MAPAKPKSYTAGSNPVSKSVNFELQKTASSAKFRIYRFEGAFVVTKHEPQQGRNINFHAIINPRHPRLLELERAGKKPPTHFHPRQWEYFKVVKGALTVEIDGVAHEFTAADGEYALRPGPHHCLYAASEQASTTVEFWLGATPSGAGQQLDQAFFENWYGYQEDVMLRGVWPDPIHMICMFEAGDSFLSPPAWMPFRHTVGWLLGVVVGRYIGGMLGYQPFFPEWTTDWEAACDKMERCWATRRFADRDAQRRIYAEYVAKGLPTGNGGLYKDQKKDM